MPPGRDKRGLPVSIRSNRSAVAGAAARLRRRVGTTPNASDISKVARAGVDSPSTLDQGTAHPILVQQCARPLQRPSRCGPLTGSQAFDTWNSGARRWPARNMIRHTRRFVRGFGAWVHHEIAALQADCFALVMATGIISNTLYVQGYRALAGALFAVDIIAYVWLALSMAWRAVRFPRKIWADFVN